ncbi:hypothetical protein CK203_032310 [Vitis vinifera]|uniref:Uncharacterized protein n=1 Tax=Vitis vinifera TaxID=29760 RepID=A0A438IJR7_VITVI|nr:hypothetical protein CK203_032310 [Vitis vinifera]
MKGRSREEESAARKGKAPMVQMEDFTQGEKTMDSRRCGPDSSFQAQLAVMDNGVAASLFPYGAQRHLAKSAIWKWMAGWDLNRYEVSERVPSSIVFCQGYATASRKEETSTSRGEMDSRKSQLEDDKGGFTGRAGYDPCGSSVTKSPSIPRTRGKEIILGGNCEIPGVENLEESQSFSSQPPEPYSSPFCDVGPLNFVGIPVHVEEENQRVVSNQMFERSTPGKSSNLMSGSPGVNAASPPEDFLIDGLSPRKMAKVREVLCSLDIKETKKEKCDRRLVGSVWTVRNKDWVILPACGASGGILFIWDSKKLCKEEVVLGSFSISVKFALEGCGPLWISAVYGPNSPSLRKDFWVELYDIYALSPRHSRNPYQKDLGSLANCFGYQPFMWGPTPFRFENMWLQHPSFKENFRNWWRGFQGNGWEGHKFMRRLQFVKAKEGME